MVDVDLLDFRVEFGIFVQEIVVRKPCAMRIAYRMISTACEFQRMHTQNNKYRDTSQFVMYVFQTEEI